MKKRGITILAIGDRADFDSYKKFNKERRLLLNAGFDYLALSYRQLLGGKIPPIRTKKVIAFLFFPFNYWSKYIEHKNYRGIYGNLTFYKKFYRFSEKTLKIITDALPDQEILFVNNPLLYGRYRDKLEVKKKLLKSGIPTPKLYNIIRIKDLKKQLDKDASFFIKTRCSSMGKGITFLTWANWCTNFIFRRNRIMCKRSDYGWHFRDITGNNAFLGKLLKKDIIIEKAIDTLILNNMRIDLRIYTFFKKALYVYPRKNHFKRVTTNISQGGRGDSSLLNVLPRHLIEKSKRIAEKTSKALGYNFAGIDVVMDRNLKDVYVVDVNAFPGFPKRRTFNISRHMAEELVKLSNSGGLRFEKGRSI